MGRAPKMAVTGRLTTCSGPGDGAVWAAEEESLAPHPKSGCRRFPREKANPGAPTSTLTEPRPPLASPGPLGVMTVQRGAGIPSKGTLSGWLFHV